MWSLVLKYYFYHADTVWFSKSFPSSESESQLITVYNVPGGYTMSVLTIVRFCCCCLFLFIFFPKSVSYVYANLEKKNLKLIEGARVSSC